MLTCRTVARYDYGMTNAIIPGTTVIDRAFANRYGAVHATLMVALSPVIEAGPYRDMVAVEFWEDGIRQTDHVWADEIVAMQTVLQSAIDDITIGRTAW